MAFSLLGEYYVEDDCTPYSESRSFINVGPIRNGVHLSPNPTADMFTLTFDDTWADEFLDIQILDVSGRQIQMNQGVARSGGEVQLSVRQWPAGVYIVQVTGREKQKTLKLVVKH